MTFEELDRVADTCVATAHQLFAAFLLYPELQQRQIVQRIAELSNVSVLGSMAIKVIDAELRQEETHKILKGVVYRE